LEFMELVLVQPMNSTLKINIMTESFNTPRSFISY
jgi:hypothetical protein